MANNYVLLQRVEVGAAGAASINFTNIPQTGYTDLKLVASMRGDQALVANAALISLNGLTTSFTNKLIEGNGASVASYSNSPGRFLGNYTGSTATVNTFSNVEVYIPNYTSSNYKSFSTDGVTENNATTSYADLNASLWSNTAAITSITVTPTSGSFVANSTFSLYGLAAVGVTPTVAPKASGGSITTDGTYWYHTFRSSGFFVPQVGLTCDALVVAGGGSGGSYYGGGGGAGGVCYQTSRSVPIATYTVTVGAGGAAANAVLGNNGINSAFDTITSNGGGGGGRWLTTGSNGLTGGSGGGGSMGTAAGNTTTGGSANQGTSGGATGYGFAGGNGYRGTPPAYKGGGGGGAGAVGTNAAVNDATDGANGGAGLNTWSSWATATSTGVSGYYAGGGGGSTEGSNPGAGGGGGGGRGAIGATLSPAVSGTANTGSGGGADSAIAPSGSGGSGVVIIRYPIV